MALIEPQFVTVLGPLVSGRVFPSGTVRTPIVYPFITYMHVGGRPTPTLCGGPQDKQNSIVQFDVWASPPSDGGGGLEQAMTIMRSASDLLTAAPLRGWVSSQPRSFYDTVTRTHGVMMDFSFWWAV